MEIIRVRHRKQWVTVDSRSIEDKRLTFRALGLLVWLLNKPDNWETNSEAIAHRSREGRDAIRTVLSELEACGYLDRRKVQAPNGQWITIWVLTELSTKPQVAPTPGKPGVG